MSHHGAPQPPAPCVSKGCLFVVSAPSGAGKTTLCAAVRRRFPELAYSVSATTRPPRPGERDGVDYHFLSVSDFREGIRSGAWAEWAEVHGNYYGTAAATLREAASSGRHVLLDIDVQGAAQLAARFPESITIFIMPPSMDALARRLSGRGTDDPDEVARRLAAAEREMAQRRNYRHIVVNDDLEAAAAALCDLVGAYISGAVSVSGSPGGGAS